MAVNLDAAVRVGFATGIAPPKDDAGVSQGAMPGSRRPIQVAINGSNATCSMPTMRVRALRLRPGFGSGRFPADFCSAYA